MKIVLDQDSVLLDIIRKAYDDEVHWNSVYEIPDAIWNQYIECRSKLHEVERYIFEQCQLQDKK